MLQHEIVEPRQGGSPSLTVLVLHGLGDSRHGWMPVAQAVDLPDLRWVFVDAPDPYYGGWSWFRIPGMTGLEDTHEDLLADLTRSRKLLAELITQLCGDDAARLVLMGFSQGCGMVLDQALRSHLRFAGVVGISGMVLAAHDYPAAFGPAARHQDILMTHGTWDPVLPLSQTRAQVQALQRAGITIDWREYAKDHTLDTQSELPALRAWLAAKAGARG